MENDFRNLIPQNFEKFGLVQLIELWLFKVNVLINVLYAALSVSCDTLQTSVMSQRYNSNGTVHKFNKILFIIRLGENASSLYFLHRCVRAKIIVHAFIYDWAWSTGVLISNKYLQKSVKSCSLMVSQILTELPYRESDIGIRTKRCQIITLKWIIKISSNFYCWVSKIATHSPNLHCCLGKLLL